MPREQLTSVQRNALQLDEALVRVARSRGAFDLAVGAVLARLFEGDRLVQLGYARESDYMRERLGIAPSLGFSWARLARELSHRPILRRAVTAGVVSTRKALAVLPLAAGDCEGAWTEAAMRLSLREIGSAVKAAGKEAPEERFEAEVLVLPMTPGQQERLDLALALAKEDLGPEARRWQCTEAICQEFLSSFAEWDGGGSGGPGPPAASAPPPRRAARLVAHQLAAVEEALEVIARIRKEHEGPGALALDGCALRLLAARRRYDETFGILAERAHEQRIFGTLGYGSLEAYGEERLGMRAGTVRQRIWLERRLRDLPSLREALSSGRLPYSKALVVARQATPFDIDARIAHARSTTCQQLEREAEAEEDRRNRGASTRKVWTPRDAAQTVRDAIAAAQARSREERGIEIDAGEALAAIADHFVAIHEAHRPAHDARRWIPRFRREVLLRKGGLCAVPGCSRAARHVHHIVFRSHGGPDTAANGVGICAAHHLHGIHRGYLEVTGRAGERLHWRFATGEASPTEEWVTFGDDDVRRADFAARDEAGGGGGDGCVEPAAAAGGRADGCVEPAADGSMFVAEGQGDRAWVVTCAAGALAWPGPELPAAAEGDSPRKEVISAA
jgi:hypothetical protein